MNTTFTTDEKKEWARLLYMKDDKNTDQVAALTSLDPALIRKWANDGQWAEIRRTKATSRHYQLEKLYTLLEQLTEKMDGAADINSKDADLLVKYTAAIKNLDPDISIPEIVDVATLFTTWLRTRDADTARNTAVLFDAFIKHRLNLSRGLAA